VGETSVGNCDVDEHEDHVEGVDEFDIDPVAKSLKELAYKSKGKFKQLLVPAFQNDVEDQDNTHIHTEEYTNQNKRRYHKIGVDYPLENLVLSEFKKLGEMMSNLNDRLNSVAMQVQDMHYRAEINEAWPTCKFEKSRDQHEYDSLRTIRTELDFAKESRTSSDILSYIEKAREAVRGYGWEVAAALLNTQDNWLKGKDILIEKTKNLAEVKKNKHQKTSGWAENQDFLFQKLINQEKAQNSYQSYRGMNRFKVPPTNVTSVKGMDIMQTTAPLTPTEILDTSKSTTSTTDQK
ncbi:1441_t:CDS:2, partial [Dentiscutata erythropus]